MLVFLFYVFNFFYWVVIALSLLIIIAVLSGGEAGALVLLVLAAPFILIRNYLASRFVVKKHRSERRHIKALERVKKNEGEKRNDISEDNAKRNIDPLIQAIRKELLQRKGDITPNTYERIESAISALRENNDTPGASELYRLIIETKPEELNERIAIYRQSTGVQI